MTSPITPDTVRALIADTEPRPPLLLDGSLPMNGTACAVCGYSVILFRPGSTDHDEDCAASLEWWRWKGAGHDLSKAAPAIALAYLAVCEERDRLARVLAVEGGDEAAAPEGWRPTTGGAWNGKEDNYVYRISAGRWSWVSRDTRNAVRGRGEAANALEAMESAGRAGGSDV